MKFITSYLEVLIHAPLFVITGSLVALALISHIVLPLVLGLWVGMWEYWSRGESMVSNWYLKKLSSVSSVGYVVKRGKYIYDFSDHGWYNRSFSDSKVSFKDATKFAAGHSDYIVVEADTPELGLLWLVASWNLMGFSCLLLAFAWLLQMLLNEYPMLLLGILGFSAGIAVVLNGGRALFDLRKKVDLIESKVK